MLNSKKVLKAMFEVDTTFDKNSIKTTMYPNTHIIDSTTDQISEYVTKTSDEMIIKRLVKNHYPTAIRLKNILDEYINKAEIVEKGVE